MKGEASVEPAMLSRWVIVLLALEVELREKNVQEGRWGSIPEALEVMPRVELLAWR